MRYFFPDSDDKVDSTFNFENESRSPDRVPRDDLYAHEIFEQPYDGILISYSVITKKIYSTKARRRLFRSGAREFFRAPKRILFMGDCGAFAYKNEPSPTVCVDHVVEFYEDTSLDYGISVDHMIREYDESETSPPSVDTRSRYDLTLDLARDFWRASKSASYIPIGAVQGWSLASYASAAKDLQRMGYRYLAIGGLVRLRTSQRDRIVSAVSKVLRPETKLHLLGVGSPEGLAVFASRQVASIDSTSPLRTAWLDARKNFYLGSETYAALRVPSSGSPRVRKKISSGEICQKSLLRLEHVAMRTISDYARRRARASDALDALLEYQNLHSPDDRRRKDYIRTLDARPWEQCHCPICADLGHHVILFRGAERNRRRGFHNVAQFYQRIREETGHP